MTDIPEKKLIEQFEIPVYRINDDLHIDLPDNLMEIMDWREGDVTIWERYSDESWTIYKKFAHLDRLKAAALAAAEKESSNE